MQITGLNHVNVLTYNMAHSIKFYEALGFRVGPRPEAFPDPGTWLYLGDHPVLHLNYWPQNRTISGGSVEHFGFSVRGSIEAWTSALAEMGIEYDLWAPITGANRALYFKGPSSERVELVFVEVEIPR